ncbi:MAG TPA: ImmA/IrrE family metallo-endopeptidase, partial [Bacteroidetes bacterium]|nr:ImmA/IrrE family metallo-endopeptidase [Bacteroidota bacterium]HEX05529.1 ImmA/IrrE family metallo-endopeptidase [Bacteroidota bacterium]
KLALWIRSGEREFDERDFPVFNMLSILDSLSRIRLLVRDTNVASATEDLIRICHEAGIAIAFVPEFKSFPLHGIAYWRGNTPHVYVNIRGRYHDIFWFTIFHEIGHILLHNSRKIFVDVEKAPKTSIDEKQADEFASDLLIPPNEYELFIDECRLTKSSIISFAEKINTHPGVVAGRLKHDKYLKWNQLNDLRLKLDWVD